MQKYDYPPEEAKNALKVVMRQVEKMCGNVYMDGMDYDMVLKEVEYDTAMSVFSDFIFDKLHKFIRLFDGSKQKKIVELISKIKENAVKIMG